MIEVKYKLLEGEVVLEDDYNVFEYYVYIIDGVFLRSPITGKVKDMLIRNIPGNPTDLVFKDRKGNNIQRISNIYYKTVGELGFNDGIKDRRQKVCFHTLRHTYASWMVQNGEDLYTVKELLGHSTLAMTERYSHLAKDNLKNAVKRFEASLKTETKDNILIMNTDQ